MKTEIQELKDRLNLIEIASLTHKIKHIGSEIFCCCPFHNEKTPSCVIHTNFFKCFACGATGDALTWLQHVNGCDFKTAVKLAEKLAGITIEHKAIIGCGIGNGFHYGNINSDCDIRFDCVSFGPSLINKFSIGTKEFRDTVNQLDNQKKAVMERIKQESDELIIEYLQSYLKSIKIQCHSYISKTLKECGEWEKFCKIKLDSGVSLYCKIHKSESGVVVAALNDEFAIQTTQKDNILSLIQQWASEWGLTVRYLKK